MPNIGPMELAIVLIIALVIVGPKKLPELGKSAGRASASSRTRSPEAATTTTRSPRSRRPRRMPRSPSRARSSRAARSGSRPEDEATQGEQGRPRRRAHRRRAPRRAAHADHRLGGVLAVAVGLCFWQNGLLLEIANGPLPGDREPITFGVTEPFFTTVKLSALRGDPAGAAGDPLSGLLVHPAGLPAGREAGRDAAADGRAGAVHRRRRVRLLRRHAGGARLPARLQRRRVQDRDPRQRVLRLLRPHPDLGRDPVPDPGRDAGGHAAGDRHPGAAGGQPPLRDPGDRGRRDAAPRAPTR